MTTLADHALLASLEAALRTDDAPSELDVAALRRLVITGERERTVVALTARPPSRAALRAAAIALAIIAGFAAVATAARSTSSPPATSVASNVFGLHHPTPFEQTQGALRDLRTALAGTDDTAVSRAAEEVVARMRALPEPQRSLLALDADALLRRAELRLAGVATGTEQALTALPSAASGSDATSPSPERATASSEQGAAVQSGDTASGAPVVVTTEHHESESELEAEHEAEPPEPPESADDGLGTPDG